MEIPFSDRRKLQTIVLENTTDNHYKFYHLSRQANSKKFLAQWGRIGNRPQSKEYDGDYNDMYTKMTEKLNKGYELKTYKFFGDHSLAYETFMDYLNQNNTKLFLFGEELV